MTLARQLLVAALGLALAAVPGIAQTFRPYTVTVSLTDAAGRQLVQAGEGIVISATYSGQPNSEGTGQANEIGTIDLGSDMATLPSAGGTATFDDTAIDAARLALIDGGILININSYSARLSSEDNVLTCDFFDGSLDTLSGTSLELTCSLITEARERDYRD